MKRFAVSAAVMAAACLCVSSAAAQWNEEQSGVWDVVAQSWADEAAENGKWPAQYVRDDVVSWGAEWPMPRGKDSLAKWVRFGQQDSTILEYELMPANITIAGDTAVVSYNAVMITENYEKKRNRSTEGLVEVLVREAGDWKYLSLTSFAINPGE